MANPLRRAFDAWSRSEHRHNVNMESQLMESKGKSLYAERLFGYEAGRSNLKKPKPPAYKRRSGR